MKKNVVIINEQHQLLEGQKTLLDKTFGIDGWELKLAPAIGWTKEEINVVYKELCHPGSVTFISPVPLLMAQLSYYTGVSDSVGSADFRVFLFHNDKREKKELPGGKIIQVISKDGWELVKVFPEV